MSKRKQRGQARARLWVFHNGTWSRIAITPHRPAEVVVIDGPAWSVERYTVAENEHTGDVGVRVEWLERYGPDAEEGGGSLFCPLGQLAAVDMAARCPAPENRGVRVPDWKPAAAFAGV